MGRLQDSTWVDCRPCQSNACMHTVQQLACVSNLILPAPFNCLVAVCKEGHSSKSSKVARAALSSLKEFKYFFPSHCCVIAQAMLVTLQVRSLGETVRLDARTKLLNPKWYEGMLNSGYEGVREIQKRLTNTVGWSATSGQVKLDVS